MYNGTVTVNLDERAGKHQYGVTDKELGMVNATVRGVSSIKSEILAKPGLMYWPMDMAIKYIKENCKPNEAGNMMVTNADLEDATKAHRKRSDQGKDTGTEVHNAIEVYLTNKGTVVLSKEASKSFSAFEKWMDKVNPEMIAVELPVYSRQYQYCGKFDGVFKINDKNVLVDFKTTNESKYALHKGKVWTGIYPEDFMQLGFYSQAWHEAGGIKLDDVMIVNVTKAGKLHTLTATEIGWDVSECEFLAMNALHISDSLKRLKKSALNIKEKMK